jgi:hypothetical protein
MWAVFFKAALQIKQVCWKVITPCKGYAELYALQLLNRYAATRANPILPIVKSFTTSIVQLRLTDWLERTSTFIGGPPSPHKSPNKVELENA